MLADHQASVQHIHGDGHLESHDDAMMRLMAAFNLDEPDLFHTTAERLAEALSRREKRIAYVTPHDEPTQAKA